MLRLDESAVSALLTSRAGTAADDGANGSEGTGEDVPGNGWERQSMTNNLGKARLGWRYWPTVYYWAFVNAVRGWWRGTWDDASADALRTLPQIDPALVGKCGHEKPGTCPYCAIDGSTLWESVEHTGGRWYVSDYLRVNTAPPDANMSRGEAIATARLLAANCGRRIPPVSPKRQETNDE